MTKKKILITGERGLLGSYLIREFSARGYEAVSSEVDIRDVSALSKFEGMSFDWIIHAAALVNVELCEKDQKLCYDTNVVGTRNMGSFAKSSGARFVYISTPSVFSGEEGGYKEADIPYPKNFYNISKLLGEEAARACLGSLIVRVSPIGIHPKGSRGRNFFEWLIDSIRENKDMSLFTDVKINPLSAASTARLLVDIIEKGTNEPVLHLGSSNVLSKAEIAKITLKAFPKYTGAVTEIAVDTGPLAVKRPKEMWLNVDTVQNAYGMRMPTLESEIDKILRELTNV